MPDGGDTREHPYRIGSEAPEAPAPTRCHAPWPGPWEDRVEARPLCTLEPGHDGRHAVERSGFDGRCFRYTWTGNDRDARREPC